MAGPDLSSSLHRGMQVRPGGYDKAQVREALAKADTDGNGEVSKAELSALAKQGRDAGFADNDAKNLFHAGIDASALAEQKTAEPGQQFTTEYLDKKMKPALEKGYGANGKEATEIAGGVATKELSKDAALRYDDSAKLDTFEKKELKTQFGEKSVFRDMNRNGKIDGGDRMMIPDGNGGYRPRPIDSTKSDAIEKNVSQARVKGGDEAMTKMTDAFSKNGPRFPDPDGDGSKLEDKANNKKWMGNKSHADGGAWKVDAFQPDPKKDTWYPEYKLDTKRQSGSAALDDMVKNPKNYVMDCAMAKQVAQYQRIRGSMGDEKFDKLVEKEGMHIGYGEAENHSGLLQKVGTTSDSTPAKLSDYHSGQAGYANIRVADAAKQKEMNRGGWGGEHFTVRTDHQGEKWVYAHPFGNKKLDDFERDMKKDLAAQYKIKESDIRITYDTPKEYDLDAAARRAR